MARALFTTCGRNILPGAEQVADDLHPVHQRPLDDVERRGVLLARLLDVGLDEVDRSPCTSACDSRSSTGASRQARSTSRFVPAPFTVSANSHQPLGGVGPAVEDHVLDVLEQILRDVLVDASWPALTMPMSMPALMAWYRNAECIASRTTSLPRNENDRLLTPPLIFTPGQRSLDLARRLDEGLRVARCAPRSRWRSRGCSGRR